MGSLDKFSNSKVLLFRKQFLELKQFETKVKLELKFYIRQSHITGITQFSIF